LNSFLTALGFLTRFPIPGSGGHMDAHSLSKSVIFFPVVGGIIGVITAGVYLVLEPFLPRSVVCVFILALPLFMTGGIHFDGLMDTCDGIFSGRSRERILEIMRDSRVGSMGVMAGIFNVMLRYSVLMELPGTILPVLLITQAATGRWVMSMALHFFPYARKDGGLGQGFGADKKLLYVILSSLLALLIIFLANGAAGIIIAVLVAAFSLFMACWVAGKLGGLTGDVYGALNEVSENVFLLLWLVAILSFHLHP
jgi:adenosylcobinamide-GDP ribazoletransferase